MQVSNLFEIFHFHTRNESFAPICINNSKSLLSGIENGLQHHKRGTYYEPKCSTKTNHCILAVGYGTDKNGDYYIVKNSWGTTWGEGGYFKMARNRNNNCAIATHAGYPKI